MRIEEKINSDYVTGAICYQESWRFYFMPPIYWVTDADYYDSDYDPNKPIDIGFRGGVGKLNISNAEVYLNAIEEDRVNSVWIKDNFLIYKDNLKPIFLVDIDEYLFVSNFYDIDYENHIALGWRGIFDDPLNYLPTEIKAIWS